MNTRILVIDDDHLVADTLCLVYQANGYESEARYSAAEGLERAKSFEPAVVLCGVTLPDASKAPDVLTRAQDAAPGSRMLLLTPHAANLWGLTEPSSEPHRNLKLLSKPCRPEDLLRETRALLNVL